MRARIVAVLAAILAVAGVVLAALAFRGVQPEPAASGPCPGGTALGRVAYLRGGTLHVLDLSTCRDRVLSSQAVAPVRWSPDGRWIAFGRAKVVPARGGRVREPLGPAIDAWSWSPVGDDLAGITNSGEVVVGRPGRGFRRVTPEGWRARDLAWDPSGNSIAVSRGEALWTIDPDTAHQRLTFRQPSGTVAPPQVAGWSRDGRWILYWPRLQNSASLAADGLPLDAVRSSGGTPVVVVQRMLPYDDFLSTCGDSVLATAGRDRYVTRGKRAVLAAPSDWRPHVVSAGSSKSWFWPACSPDGTRVAVTVTPNGYERRFAVADRDVWTMSSNGAHAHVALGSARFSDEFPQWTPDSRSLLFVRTGRRPQAGGRLFLVNMRTGHLSGPLATLEGAAGGYYGHASWSSVMDWYRPA